MTTNDRDITPAEVRAQAAAMVTTAEEEAAEAVELVEALEEKVWAGDDTVSPEELASARELGRFARPPAPRPGNRLDLS